MSSLPSSDSDCLCFHCGLPADNAITANINDESHAFCCVACKSVAQAIALGGLGDFYRYRDELNEKANTVNTDFSFYDQEEFQSTFVKSHSEHQKEAQLNVSNMSCAACAWLIEHFLMQVDGVENVRVNVTTARLNLSWNTEKTSLSFLVAELHRIGYLAQPYQSSQANENRQRESKLALMRLGVAGIGMMQVGMYAIALHAGDYQSMETSWRWFFRWVSLLVATPVVFFSARPFFESAIRAIKQRYLNMDVPVSLAIGLAYVASVFATLSNQGEVYFDSVSMFTFFLLLGRFIEMRARHSSAFVLEDVSRVLPLTATRVIVSEQEDDKENVETVPLAVIAKGDCVHISSGNVVPCDGEIVRGKSYVDESMLSGEAEPVEKCVGDQVFAGTHNVDSAIVVRCTATGEDTKLAVIGRLFDEALMTRPKTVSMADAIASKFVLAVLILTSLVAGVWLWLEPSRALWVSLSVLVATCPCALSLATPTAITAGTLAMKRLGLLVLSSQFVETLASIQHVVFDKTGTLTQGKLVLKEIVHIRPEDTPLFSDQDIENVAATLESVSQHPIATAFKHISSPLRAQEIKNDVGKGVVGTIDGKQFRLGKVSYAAPSHELDYPSEGIWLLLSCDLQPVAWLQLGDKERECIASVQASFKKRQLEVSVLSGDRKENVQPLAEKFQWPWLAEQQPEDKLAYIKGLQSNNKKILMLGDGINDVPVLGGADLSIAMGEATRLAKTRADAILLGSSLAHLPDIFDLNSKIKQVIRQNLSWALIYNATVLPIAAMGLLPPYLAAIGMSASSLLVVLNAVRLSRIKMYSPPYLNTAQ